jgi:Cytochrome P450
MSVPSVDEVAVDGTGRTALGNGKGALRSIADLPAPRGLPALGNLHQTWRLYRAHLVVEGWADRFGPIFKFRVGRRLTVVISDVDEINRVLRERPEGYRRWREIEAGFREMGFPGVFSVEGEDWRRQRRLAVTALNSNHLHRHFHVIRTATERLRRRLSDAARDGQACWAQEALEVLGDESYPTDYELVSRFTYGEAVLREAMRLKELELDDTRGPVKERFTFTMIPEGLRVRLRERAPLESMPVGATG